MTLYRGWKPAEDAALIEGRANGLAHSVIGKRLGRTADQCRSRFQRINAKQDRAAEVPAISDTLDEATDTRTLDGDRVQTLEQLLTAARVDRDVWEVERHVINKWEVGAKHPTTGDIVVEPLWQVKAWLKRKASVALVEHIERLKAHISADTALRKHAPPLRPSDALREEAHMLEIDPFDVHLGKLSWEPETGNDYDVAIAEARVREAMEDILWQASLYRLTRILLPLGNDWFHVDTITGLTTGGTPQDRDTRFHRMYERGRGLASWMIHRCAEVAPTSVVIVPGNHDTQTAYTMGDSLYWEYKSDPRVTVDNAPTFRKYVRFGANLVGFTHGNEEKVSELPNIMATEQPQAWGETLYREWHIGHLHRPKELTKTPVNSFNGVRVREITSLSGDDAWHTKKGYKGEPKGMEAFVWRFSGGVRNHLTHLTAVSRAA